MDPPRKKFEEKIVKEKLAVFTFNDAMQEPSFRRYFIKNWYNLTVGMKKSTILFLGGVHGKKTGQFGGYVSFKTLTNQVSIFSDNFSFICGIMVKNISLILVYARSS